MVAMHEAGQATMFSWPVAHEIYPMKSCARVAPACRCAAPAFVYESSVRSLIWLDYKYSAPSPRHALWVTASS